MTPQESFFILPEWMAFVTAHVIDRALENMSLQLDVMALTGFKPFLYLPDVRPFFPSPWVGIGNLE